MTLEIGVVDQELCLIRGGALCVPEGMLIKSGALCVLGEMPGCLLTLLLTV